MRTHSWIGKAMLGAAILIVATPAAARAEEGAAFAALQRAHQAETEAGARYLHCARIADEECLPGIACLFRTVAGAESVHAANHAWVIEQQGGRAVAWEGVIELGDTEKNLERACANERREFELVYPRFAAYARAEHDYEALATLLYAKSAEASHEQLFKAALDSLRNHRAAQPTLIVSLDALVLPEPCYRGPNGGYSTCLGCGRVGARVAKSCPNCNYNSSHSVTRCGP